MVFKRRDRRGVLSSIGDFLYPRGGWRRAFHYVKHRLRRLPDTPERIARGIWAGVFTTFTPFYGLHFIIAAVLAKVMRGNILAALLGTFFGNPLTYLPIGVISLETGHFLLGLSVDEEVEQSLGRMFANAGRDLWHNFLALFTDATADWHNLVIFFHDVFYPYMIGGVLPGIVAGTVAYYISVPLIRAYQKHRRGVIAKKIDAIKQKAAAKAEAKAETKAGRAEKRALNRSERRNAD